MGTALTSLPEGFTPHRMVGKIYQQRAGMVSSGKAIDWALAEQLAWGTLLLEGNHVRISGQDVERGTFSHRHCVIHDQKAYGSKHMGLKHISPSQAEFNACNSSLSEFAVLGFELGFSLENPASLIMWEAQFGDFANTAQCMIDQFICSGEQKWLRQSGLVMLLPHGYEGQGPEHSSARLERFLQVHAHARRPSPPHTPTLASHARVLASHAPSLASHTPLRLPGACCRCATTTRTSSRASCSASSRASSRPTGRSAT